MARSADLIGQLIGGLMAPRSGGRLQHAFGSGGLGAADNPLGGLLGQFGSAMGQPAAGAMGGGPAGGGLMQIAMQALGGLHQRPGAAGGAGALAGMVLGGGRGAMRGGALALLGSLAASALSQSGRQTAPSSPDALPGSLRAMQADPAEDPALAARSDVLLEAMVNAAKADGQIDQHELERLEGKLAEDGIDQAEINAFHRLMQAPMDLDGLVAKVTDPQMAAEVYAASALAIEIDTNAERTYLRALAQRTGLDDATVASLHRILDLPE